MNSIFETFDKNKENTTTERMKKEIGAFTCDYINSVPIEDTDAAIEKLKAQITSAENHLEGKPFNPDSPIAFHLFSRRNELNLLFERKKGFSL